MESGKICPLWVTALSIPDCHHQLQVPSTLTSPSWWNCTSNCEQNKPSLSSIAFAGMFYYSNRRVRQLLVGGFRVSTCSHHSFGLDTGDIAEDRNKGAYRKRPGRQRLLIPLGENKTTTTIFELNLMQVLLNTGHDDGYWPGPHLEFPENGTNLH